MAALLDERGDDSSEGEERLVDHTGFSCALVRSAGSSDGFGPREVDEVELADFKEIITARCQARLLDMDGEGEDRV